MSETVELKGTISEGLFSSESVFVFKDAQGREISIVAPSDVVSYKGELGLVRVRVLKSDGKRFLVHLPGEVYGATQEVTVSNDQVQAVA